MSIESSRQCSCLQVMVLVTINLIAIRKNVGARTAYIVFILQSRITVFCTSRHETVLNCALRLQIRSRQLFLRSSRGCLYKY